jgi:hypothetical protein
MSVAAWRPIPHPVSQTLTTGATIMMTLGIRKVQERVGNLTPMEGGDPNPTPFLRMESVAYSPAIVLSITAACVAHIVLIAIVLWRQPHMLNNDAVAYLTLAAHYAKGETDLAVTGYWGPLFSWLIADFLFLFDLRPVDAARIVMGLSSVSFVVACLYLWRSLRLPPVAMVLCLWITSVASVPWTVKFIAPDLLWAAFVCLGMSTMLRNDWLTNRRLHVAAGGVWGAPYLTEAIAFPLTFLIGTLIGTFHIMAGAASTITVRKSLVRTWGTFALIAFPWIMILSVTYGTPTFQIRVMFWNSNIILSHLSNFDWLHLGVGFLLVALLPHTPWRHTLRHEPWRWSGILVLGLVSLYLPVWAPRRYPLKVYKMQTSQYSPEPEAK